MMQRVNVASLVKGRGIELISYCAPEKLALATAVFKPVKDLNSTDIDMTSHNSMDLLWRIDESVKLLWMRSMHRCATVYTTLTSLTELDRSTNDGKHVEMGRSTVNRDNEDLLKQKLVSFFENHNPFTAVDERLHTCHQGKWRLTQTA
jgi:hypothetical protein